MLNANQSKSDPALRVIASQSAANSRPLSDTYLEYSLKQISVACKSTYEIVKIADIQYIQADGNYTKIFVGSSRNYLLSSKNLKQWESIINNELFFRCHKSYLINTLKIKQLCLSESQIKMAHAAIPFSRSKKQELLAVIHK